MQVYTGLFVMEIIYIHITTLTFIIKTIDTYTVSPIMPPNHLIRFSYRPVIFSINAITEMRQAIQPPLGFEPDKSGLQQRISPYLIVHAGFHITPTGIHHNAYRSMLSGEMTQATPHTK